MSTGADSSKESHDVSHIIDIKPIYKDDLDDRLDVYGCKKGVWTSRIEKMVQGLT